MNVLDLIDNLRKYANKAPENAGAEVRLQWFEGMTYGIAGANDARGMPGQVLLLIVPDLNDKLGVKEMKIQ